MIETAKYLAKDSRLGRKTVVLTGAMRPYELRASDALQNMTEAILAVQLLDSGVYCVLHSKILTFPGVAKDAELGTFKSTGSHTG